MKQLKTHCVHGHEYTPENIMWSDGRRKCRKCNAKRSRRYYNANYKKPRTAIRFRIIAAIINDPTKSYYDISCDLNCSYEWVKHIAREMGQPKRKPGRAKKTHCPQGHPYAGDNVTWSKGYPKCKICAAKHKRTFRANRQDQSVAEIARFPTIAPHLPSVHIVPAE